MTRTETRTSQLRPLQLLCIILTASVAISSMACGGEEPVDDGAASSSPISSPADNAPEEGSKRKSLASEDTTVDPALENNLVYACIRSTACDVKPYPRVSNCVAYYKDMAVALGEGPVYDNTYRCANRTNTCQSLEACFGITGACNSTYQASCDGGKARFCDLLDKTTMAQDCAAAGMDCQLDPKYGFAAKCVPSATGGAPTQPSPQGGMTATVDCKDGRCQRTGESCTEDDLNRCAGADMQACLDGEWVTFDCAKLSLGACQTETSGWARCSAK